MYDLMVLQKKNVYVFIYKIMSLNEVFDYQKLTPNIG